MTSPPKAVTLDCPACGAEFEAWCRPSINLNLDEFDANQIAEATTATCPECGASVDLDALIVESDKDLTDRSG